MQSIPVIKKTDVLILGATTGAVAAAVSVRRAGADAYVVSHLNYMGEDVCAHLQYELRDDEAPNGPLGRAVFEGDKRPARIKCALEQALVKADADVLMGSFPVGALEDAQGNVVGAIVANRCGRQAIIAKRIIDTTEHGIFAKLAGAPFSTFSGGTVKARFRIVAPAAAQSAAVVVDDNFTVELKEGPSQQSIFEYTADEPMNAATVTDWMGLNKQLIHRYWQHDAALISEHARVLPVERLQGNGDAEDTFTDYTKFNIDALRCCDNAVTVLGPAAHVTDAVAEKLARPFHNMTLGNRIGKIVAEEAASVATPHATGIKTVGEALPQDAVKTPTDGKVVGESIDEHVSLSAESLPRLGQWDTVVVGGGTGGASAAIASARQGVKTAVLEYQHALGGVGTIGQISVYYHGNRVGFTRQIDEGVFAMGPAWTEEEHKYRYWKPSWKQAWYHGQLMASHVDLLLQSTAYGVWTEGSEVKGILVATPYGHGLVEAKSVIDSSGAAEVASAAGAPCRVIKNDHVAVQGTGLSPISPARPYNNTDHNFIDDSAVTDVTAAMISSKLKFKDAFDMSQLVNSRERRQIYGEYELSPIDFFNDHTFKDSICLASSNFDTHGFTVHDVFTMKEPHRDELQVYVPFRALLPQGLDNVVVTGLGVSAQRDVLPVIRMQPDVQNQGYAMGYAASLVAGTDVSLRHVDIKAVQKHLIEIDNLYPEVLDHKDPTPVTDEAIAEAVASGWDDHKGLAIMFHCKDRALPLIKTAYASAEGEQKLAYAKILGLMGNNTGEATLVDAIANTQWDEGWNYRGMGQFGMSMSQFDATIMAAGRAGAVSAVDALVKRVNDLDGDCCFSHARAISIAAEGIGEKDVTGRLAEAIYNLLQKPGIAGHHQHTIKDVQRDITDDRIETNVRNRSLRELVLGRALFYAGDKNGLGEKTLQHYAKDMRGIYARHACAVLESRKVVST